MIRRDEKLSSMFDPNVSRTVVASAGTGKTYNLVRRYIKLVATLDPATGQPWANPSQVVAVTFTRAAAAEMRQRIIHALSQPSEAVDPRDVTVREALGTMSQQRRVDLMEMLAAAPIDTIHGLCARLLREYPELSGVPLDTRPIEPDEDAIACSRVVAGGLDRILDDRAHPLHLDARDLLAEHTLTDVRKNLVKIIGFPDTAPESWGNSEGVAKARQVFVEAQVRHVQDAVAMNAHKALELCEETYDRLERAILARMATFDSFLEVFRTFLERAEDCGPEEALALIKQLKSLRKGDINKNQSNRAIRAAFWALCGRLPMAVAKLDAEVCPAIVAQLVAPVSVTLAAFEQRRAEEVDLLDRLCAERDSAGDSHTPDTGDK